MHYRSRDLPLTAPRSQHGARNETGQGARRPPSPRPSSQTHGGPRPLSRFLALPGAPWRAPAYWGPLRPRKSANKGNLLVPLQPNDAGLTAGRRPPSAVQQRAPSRAGVGVPSLVFRRALLRNTLVLYVTGGRDGPGRNSFNAWVSPADEAHSRPSAAQTMASSLCRLLRAPGRPLHWLGAFRVAHAGMQQLPALNTPPFGQRSATQTRLAPAAHRKNKRRPASRSPARLCAPGDAAHQQRGALDPSAPQARHCQNGGVCVRCALKLRMARPVSDPNAHRSPFDNHGLANQHVGAAPLCCSVTGPGRGRSAGNGRWPRGFLPFSAPMSTAICRAAPDRPALHARPVAGFALNSAVQRLGGPPLGEYGLADRGGESCRRP